LHPIEAAAQLQLQATGSSALISVLLQEVVVLLQSNEEVSQLLVQLPQAKSAAETFSIFADRVMKMFGGVQGIR
jgi:hypothetical protein